MSKGVVLALAAAGTLSGLLWRWPTVGRYDVSLARFIHMHPATTKLDVMLEFARPLGTKWSLLAVLALVLLLDWRRGVVMAVTALLAAGIERSLKLLLRRRRPFLAVEGIELRQAELPDDPSFPSGDAVRVWFVLGSLALGLRAPMGFVALAALATALVSWGRVRLGAHYPLDVWGGAWLGLGFGQLWGKLLG